MEPVEMTDTSAESVAKRPFACFQELIFCSLCAVALEVNPKENVFQAMRSVFRCDAQSKTLQGRIRGAKWANRAIYLLSRTNRGSYSWDIIYVASNQVNFYSEFNDYSIKPDELIKGLKPEFNPVDTQTISVPLAIPSIIRTIFRDLVPLEKICECLGYEFRDYNELDLSGLEELLAVPDDTDPNDIGPKKKRKKGPPKTSSKRRCRDVSSGSPEGDYFGTFTGSIHATPAPSAPNSCSDYIIDGLFEDLPTCTSSPTEGSLGIDAHEEMIDSRVGDANCSPLTSNHSALPDIVLPRDARSRTSSTVTMPDFELENRTDQLSAANLCFGVNGTLDLESNSSSNMATSSASATPSQTFSPNNITQQRSKSVLCNLQVDTVHIDSEESHSRMGKTCSKNMSCNSGCESHEYRNEHASHTRPSPLWTDWSQQYGWDIDDILQQQGLPANNPQLPPSTDWSQQYGWDIDDILQQQGLPANNPQLPPSTDWSQQYGWDIDDILQQQGLPANNPQLPPSTDWSQQYGWDIDDILQQQGLPANNPQLPPSTDWSQQYGWDIDDILQQQGLPANNPQLPPSTDWSQQYGWDIDDILQQQGLPANNPQLPPLTSWWQQCTSDLLQQDLSPSSHPSLPSLGSGQEAATAISGNSPESRYHLLFRSSLVSREGNSSWDLENSHHALGFSDPIHQNASYSPNRSLSVM
ncbi:hypothetical protein N7501_003410 [Penicillium viridicatum]|nr:hypothetical protein N7501_003410 [Penicillium viridicatum]